MKCDRCNTKLFDCDIVKVKYATPLKLSKIETIYRCPKCFSTKVVKE